MSTDSESRDIAGRAVRAFLPLVAAAAVGASLLAGDLGEAWEVRAIAPREVRPGETLPVRAVVFPAREGDAPDGPVDAEVRAFLRAEGAGGFRTARVALAPSAVLGVEGALRVPEDAPERVVLVVEAEPAIPGAGVARATRTVRVRVDARGASRRAPSFGEVPAIAHGPIRAATPDAGAPSAGAASVPDVLEASLASGRCVPELPCELALATDDPRVTMTIAAPPHVEVASRGPSSAIVVVHGPEATLELVGSRDGAIVARRDVRLPLAPGGVAVEVARRVVRAGESPGLTARSVAAGPLAVDVFRDDRWVLATSLRVRAGEATRLPDLDLGPGTYRVQVARHAFTEESADRAGVAVFRVEPRGVDAPVPARAGDGLEPLAYVLAPPASFGGVSASEAEVAHGRTRRRAGAAGVALAAGLASALLLVRGARSSRAAIAAGGGLPGDRRGRGERVAYVLLLLFVFGAVAAFVWVAR